MTAIKLAEVFAKTDTVWVLPWWSERPTMFRRNPIINGVEYIRRNISLALVSRMIKSVSSGSFRGVLNYARGLNKIKYVLLYIFDRAHINLILTRNKVSVIHIHGFDLCYLPYIDSAISGESAQYAHPMACILSIPTSMWILIRVTKRKFSGA